MNVSSLAAPEVVILTTSGAASDDKFINVRTFHLGDILDIFSRKKHSLQYTSHDDPTHITYHSCPQYSWAATSQYYYMVLRHHSCSCLPAQHPNYHQISNIRCTSVGDKIVDHSDVVEAAPTGDAPTTSEWSTQISNIRCISVGDKIVDHSDVVRALPVRGCSNCIFILCWTPGFNGLGKNNYKMRRETFKFGDLVHLILEVWQ